MGENQMGEGRTGMEDTVSGKEDEEKTEESEKEE